MSMTRNHLSAALAAVFVFTTASAGAAAPEVSKAISAAVADSARPDEDRQRDAARHPAELLAFAGVKPGQKIADYISGGGYFTRIFAKAVGPKGHVYAVWPQFIAEHDKEDAAKIKALAAAPGYSNVSYALTPDDRFTVSEPLDLVWTSQNYHDLQFGLKPDQIVQVDKAIFAALKPGGVFLVIDHVAAAGSGWTVARTLHRIDPAAIKADMAAAGFVLEGESDVLRNPADPHTAGVFDPSIRGKTDQVVLKFVRPK
jgi:predicted methyltransferase